MFSSQHYRGLAPLEVRTASGTLLLTGKPDSKTMVGLGTVEVLHNFYELRFLFADLQDGGGAEFGMFQLNQDLVGIGQRELFDGGYNWDLSG